MALFNLLGEDLLMKAEWRSASMECGGQCVMTAGIAMMVQLSADNWVTESAQVELIYLTLTLFVPILISDFTLAWMLV